MSEPPWRTGNTDLTENELLLFDLLFDSRRRLWQMSQEEYRFNMNCSYSHGIGDEQLPGVLDDLCSRGLVWVGTLRSDPSEKIYTLSERGGQLWEQERLPDWNRYVSFCHRPDGRLRVGCIREEIARLCIGAMFASGQITPKSRMRAKWVTNCRLVPWRAFPEVALVRASATMDFYDSCTPVYFDVYEESRIWWQSIDEMRTWKRLVPQST